MEHFDGTSKSIVILWCQHLLLVGKHLLISFYPKVIEIVDAETIPSCKPKCKWVSSKDLL